MATASVRRPCQPTTTTGPVWEGSVTARNGYIVPRAHQLIAATKTSKSENPRKVGHQIQRLRSSSAQPEMLFPWGGMYDVHCKLRARLYQSANRNSSASRNFGAFSLAP